jgi:hypothetical protein
MTILVTPEFKRCFDRVHDTFGSSPDEIADEKERIRLGGDIGLPIAWAYYESVAALLDAGWNPIVHPHIALWRAETARIIASEPTR